MNKLIICVGISGSGKSTWSTNYIRENPNTLRINRDDIRRTLVGSLDGYYQRKDLQSIERVVNNIEDEITDTLWSKESNIIIDDTNLKQDYLNRWIIIFKSRSYLIQFKLFDISLEEAQIRVAHREKMHSFEDLGYIDKQFKQYKQIKKYLETNHKNQII